MNALTGLFHQVLEISLALSALIALLLLARPLLQRRYRAKWAYWAWLVLALRLAVPFNLTLPRPPVQVPVSDLAVVYRPDSGLAVDRVIDAAQAPDPLKSGALSSVAPAPELPRLSVFRLHHAAALLWAAGGLAFLGWQLLAYARFCRKIRRWRGPEPDPAVLARFDALRAEAGVRRLALGRCPAISSPMVTGFLRPALLLPAADFSPQALDAVFRHELVHAKRHDIWYKLLLLLARCVHWFNPLVHLMARRAGRDLEVSCDEAVVSGRDEAFRRDYGRAVLDAVACARDEHAPLTTYFKGGRRAMLERLKAILSTLPKRRGIALLAAVVLVAATLAAACSVGRSPAAPPSVAAEYYTLTAPAATETLSYSEDGGARFLDGAAVLGGMDVITIPIGAVSSPNQAEIHLGTATLEASPNFSAVLGDGEALDYAPLDNWPNGAWTVLLAQGDNTYRHFLYSPSYTTVYDLWFDTALVEESQARACADTFRFGAQFTPSPDGTKAVSLYKGQYLLWDLTGDPSALTLNQAGSGGIRGGPGPLALSDPLWSPDGEKAALTASAGCITTFCFPMDLGPFYPEWRSRGKNGVADLVAEALGNPFALSERTVRACVPLEWAADSSALKFSYELVDADGSLQSGTAWYAMGNGDSPVFGVEPAPARPLLEGPLSWGALLLAEGDAQVYCIFALPQWPEAPPEDAAHYEFLYGGGGAGALELAPMPAGLTAGADGRYHRAEEGADAWYYPLPGAEETAVRFTWRGDQPALGEFLARHVTLISAG